MVYRVLDVDTEWPLIEHEFISRGHTLPNPMFAMIIAAFETDQPSSAIMGFVVCQLQFHAEPLVVNNPHCLSGLISTMEQELLRRVGPCTYYAFAEGRVAKVAQLLGLQKVEMEIFNKTLENQLE